MCVFAPMQGEWEKAGLATLDSFPLPLPHGDDLGVDVVIGWRIWNWKYYSLLSPYMGNTWMPGKVMDAGGKPSNRWRICGIHAYSSEGRAREAVSGRRDVLGSVALFGRVLQFTSVSRNPTRDGALGEFAYPLHLYTRSPKVSREIENLWKGTGVGLDERNWI